MAVGKFGSQLDTITYAGIAPATDFLTVCDVNGDDAGTGPEDKKIAVVEFTKRSLGSADVSWMSALLVADADHATADLDRFVVYDASATAFKVVAAADLLNNTFAGKSIAGISPLSLALVDGAADYIVFWDNSAAAWRKIAFSSLLSRLSPNLASAITSTPRTVADTEVGARFSNRGATQIIEFDLPAATAGMKYYFNRIASYAVRLDPNGSETIGEGAAGKYLEITTRGQVALECLTAGEWEVVGGSVTFTWEP